MSKELTVTESKLQKMSQKELENFAEEKSKLILEKIESSTQKIAEAKEQAEIASNMSGGWFGRTRRKADATADAVIATNEAVAEMNALLQESIRFTCVSIGFAQAMSKHISALMVKGFETSNGEYMKLSSDSKEQAMYIIQQADAFAKNQLEVETKQAKQDEKIDIINKKLEEKDSLDDLQSKQIGQLSDRMNDKDEIDAEQSKRLEELSVLLANKDLVDQKQEEALNLLFEYTKQKDILDKKQSEDIEKLLKRKNSSLVIISFILSLLSFIGISVLYVFPLLD